MKEAVPGTGSSHAQWQHQNPMEVMVTSMKAGAPCKRELLWALPAETRQLHTDPHGLEALEAYISE